MVGPIGQDLIEGLGEFENPWGYHLDDIWFAQYFERSSGFKSGTQELDDKAKEEFHKVFAQNPQFYFKTLVWRLPQIILPALPWKLFCPSPFCGLDSIRKKIKHAFSSYDVFIEFLMRQIYMRLFVFIGYCGIFLALRNKHYFATALLIGGVMLAGLGKYPSHIEPRYLIPYYWILAFFVGYAISYCYRFMFVHKYYLKNDI